MNFTKDSIYIRKKKLSNGNLSLYLDIYSNGMRVYEFMKLYLIPETSRKNKLQNKETLHEAEKIRIQRLAEISMHPLQCNKRKTNLLLFVKDCISKKKKGTSYVYRNVLNLIEEHFGKDSYVEDIDDEKTKTFFEFIEKSKNKHKPDKPLSKTTQNLYCSIFKIFLRHAADEGLLQYDIAKKIKIVKKEEKARQYLSINELQMIVDSHPRKAYRRAFLFSCLTGLRKSDVSKLLWSDVIEQDGFTRIVFRQKKTSSVEYLDISDQAKAMMGVRKGNLDRVFKSKFGSYTNKAIDKWVKSFGINKDITFHCARHTFAVMMQTIGVDINTTSKLLGHKDIRTTLIYAKIVDKKKQEAVTKIPIKI